MTITYHRKPVGERTVFEVTKRIPTKRFGEIGESYTPLTVGKITLEPHLKGKARYDAVIFENGRGPQIVRGYRINTDRACRRMDIGWYR